MIAEINLIKLERSDRRSRSLLRSKQSRRKCRSGSEQGKHIIGNGCGKFCSFCHPTLRNRLDNKDFVKFEAKSSTNRSY